MKKITLNIKGMHCSSCAMNIEFDLEDLEGVESSKCSYAKQICEVEYDEQRVTLDKIITSIKKTGYQVGVL